MGTIIIGENKVHEDVILFNRKVGLQLIGNLEASITKNNITGKVYENKLNHEFD